VHPLFSLPLAYNDASLPQAFMLKRVSEEPLGHAASVMADILENAESSGIISALQKRTLLQEIASRLL
jgi:diacylglycerol kinase (ATP)